MQSQENIVRCNDLPKLQDIFDILKPDDKNIISNEDEIHIEESAAMLIDSYIKDNVLTMHDPAFHDNLFTSVYNILELHYIC